jgi:transposase-like protein
LNDLQGLSYVLNPYDTLLKAVQDAHVFKRNKRPLEQKVVACLLYLSGLSYRAMTYQTRLIGASHVSVHNWVHALKGVISRPPRRQRKVVAIDETKLKIHGKQVYVWAAIDTDTKELLAVYASYQRSIINTIVFMKKVLETCTDGSKPVVLVDGGPWYPWALNEMGFKWLHVTFGERNAIERLFRTLKERTRRFYNNLPSHRLDNLQSFMDVFMLWYNRLRRHQGLDAFPVEVSLS